MARWFIVAGLVLQFAPAWLQRFGCLPGDIRIESGHGKVFIPVTSMLILSLVLTLLLNLFSGKS